MLADEANLTEFHILFSDLYISVIIVVIIIIDISQLARIIQTNRMYD